MCIRDRSGAEHRMNRDLSGGFGSEKYAIEELRAEIASAFMANEFGIDMPDSLLDDHKACLLYTSLLVGRKSDRRRVQKRKSVYQRQRIYSTDK